MPQNLEIKARLRDPDRALAIVSRLQTTPGGILLQTDTYFNVPRGRLKLREIVEGPAELIYYERGEETDQRVSDFQIYRSHDAGVLKHSLSLALGIRAVVKKKRTLFLKGATRIHIDEVEGLGHFIEFEVPSDDRGQEAAGIMNQLLAAFQIDGKEFVRSSYVDLILASSPKRPYSIGAISDERE